MMQFLIQWAAALLIGPPAILLVNFIVESVVLFSENRLSAVHSLRRCVAGFIGGALGMLVVLRCYQFSFGHEMFWFLPMLILLAVSVVCQVIGDEENVADWGLSMFCGMILGLIMG